MKVIVHEPVPVPAPPKTYDLLGLTEQEAKALRVVCQFIGGDYYKSLWGVFDRIDAALANAGVDIFSRGCNYRALVNGGIYFNEGELK